MQLPAGEDTSVPGDLAGPSAEKPLCPQHTHCLGVCLLLCDCRPSPMLSNEQLPM